MFYEYEGEEDQHSENCNFIYGNCDCQMSDPDISENDRIFAELENSVGNWEAALIENEEITFLGNIEGGNTCDAFYSHGLGISSDGSTGVGMGWINCGTFV